MFLFCFFKKVLYKCNETTAVRLSVGIYDEIDETTILKIKAAIAFPFRSRLTKLVVQ